MHNETQANNQHNGATLFKNDYKPMYCLIFINVIYTTFTSCIYKGFMLSGLQANVFCLQVNMTKNVTILLLHDKETQNADTL